jgi:hypothetical protein
MFGMKEKEKKIVRGRQTRPRPRAATWLLRVIHSLNKTQEIAKLRRILRTETMKRWDLCFQTPGFIQNLGWEMAMGTPLQDPLLCVCDSRHISLLAGGVNT